MVDTPATDAAFSEQFENLRRLRDDAAAEPEDDGEAVAAYDAMIADLHRIAREVSSEAGG